MLVSQLNRLIPCLGPALFQQHLAGSYVMGIFVTVNIAQPRSPMWNKSDAVLHDDLRHFAIKRDMGKASVTRRAWRNFECVTEGKRVYLMLHYEGWNIMVHFMGTDRSHAVFSTVGNEQFADFSGGRPEQESQCYNCHVACSMYILSTVTFLQHI
jgi:hypothetical protein